MSATKPKGESGEKAELLAQKMLKAVNYSSLDTTDYIQWTFSGIHQYLWDRVHNTVRVNWGDKVVYLSTKTLKGKVLVKGEELQGEAKEKLIQKAWAYFCNDSFWLMAYAKVYDEGVERSLINLQNGSEALLVTYNTGGVTPGDSYLWVLDDTGLPKSWKIWTSIVPIGGLEFSWENWTETSTGFKIAQDHIIGPMNVSLTDVAAFQKEDILKPTPAFRILREL